MEHRPRHCEWGKKVNVADSPEDWCFDLGDTKPNKKIFKLWPGNYGRQIRALHRIFYDFKIRDDPKQFKSLRTGAYNRTDICVVRMTIEPNNASENSKFIFANVKLTDKGGNSFSLTKALGKDLVLDSSFVWLEEEKSGSNTIIKSITVEWFDEKYSSVLAKEQNLNRPDAVGIGVKGLEEWLKTWRWLKLYYEGKVDVFGDGTCVVPAYGNKRKHVNLRQNIEMKGAQYSFYKTQVYKGGGKPVTVKPQPPPKPEDSMLYEPSNL